MCESVVVSAVQVMLFKGFSILTNLGYEATVPQRAEEMVLAIIAQFVKVLIDAYILGTLFHYLVKSDPEVMAQRELMHSLEQYCLQRQLPSMLIAKITKYVQFQQQHSSAVSSEVLQVCSAAGAAAAASFSEVMRDSVPRSARQALPWPFAQSVMLWSLHKTTHSDTRVNVCWLQFRNWDTAALPHRS